MDAVRMDENNADVIYYLLLLTLFSFILFVLFLYSSSSVPYTLISVASSLFFPFFGHPDSFQII